jgi:Tfp pilus assembly protein PilP
MRTVRAVLASGLLAVLVTALGCEQQSIGPKTEDFTAEREALMERMARKKDKDRTVTAKAKGKATRKKGDGDSFAGMDSGGFTYDPTGRRDPFRSFEWERPDRRDEDALRGPLEKFDLNQLDLVAVVWDTDNAKALIKDPAGQSYIIGNGTRIGKNEGRVLQVDDNRIVVKETYVDHLGQKSTKDIEMRIRESEGG